MVELDELKDIMRVHGDISRSRKTGSGFVSSKDVLIIWAYWLSRSPVLEYFEINSFQVENLLLVDMMIVSSLNFGVLECEL